MLTITILVDTIPTEPLPMKTGGDFPPESHADEAAISDEEFEQILTIRQRLEEQGIRWSELQTAPA